MTSDQKSGLLDAASDAATDGGSTTAESQTPVGAPAPTSSSASVAVAWSIPPMNLSGLKPAGTGKEKSKNNVKDKKPLASGSKVEEKKAATSDDEELLSSNSS